jgi:hypothetical protein
VARLEWGVHDCPDGKRKVVPFHDMKIYGGNRNIAPLIPESGTFTPIPRYSQRNNPWQSFNRLLGGSQSRSARF